MFQPKPCSIVSKKVAKQEYCFPNNFCNVTKIQYQVSAAKQSYFEPIGYHTTNGFVKHCDNDQVFVSTFNHYIYIAK